MIEFNIEEINFICIALGKTKDETISNIYDMLPDITDEEMKDIAERVISKLDGVSEDEFNEYNFSENFAE